MHPPAEKPIIRATNASYVVEDLGAGSGNLFISNIRLVIDIKKGDLANLIIPLINIQNLELKTRLMGHTYILGSFLSQNKSYYFRIMVNPGVEQIYNVMNDAILAIRRYYTQPAYVRVPVQAPQPQPAQQMKPPAEQEVKKSKSQQPQQPPQHQHQQQYQVVPNMQPIVHENVTYVPVVSYMPVPQQGMHPQPHLQQPHTQQPKHHGMPKLNMQKLKQATQRVMQHVNQRFSTPQAQNVGRVFVHPQQQVNPQQGQQRYSAPSSIPVYNPVRK
ncbi:hypothetical protein PCE1_003058 [Barthelona sp. PCE]